MSDDTSREPASEEPTGQPPAASKQYEFKAQVQRVLSLVINSLYTHPEVFLRELVSNASDALDRARLLQLTDQDAREQQGEPAITITLDKDKRTLAVEDNGVGMTRDEVVENLGTIARSGTAEFLDRFAELTRDGNKEQAIELIGQFGVGFYSVFMVAKRVDVETLSMHAGAEPVLWRSTGEESFTVLPGERTRPGTRVLLHLKDDPSEFAESWRVRKVIERYSNFVMFPITVNGEPANKSVAPWRQTRTQVSAAEHAEFFKHISGGGCGDEPLLTIHYAVDAPVQFQALMYVPEKAPPDIFLFRKERPGLRLYTKRVLIMESCESLLPPYLRFLRGVVDTEEVQLNVSRETLQENRTVKQIEQQLTKQILKSLGELAADEPDRYRRFWREFGQVLKEGIAVDFKNKDRLAELYRFASLATPTGELISLKQYLDAKPTEQKEIFYLTGSSREQLAHSPHLEVFRARGLDVLLLADPIDEWVVNALPEHGGCKLKSIAHGELDLGGLRSATVPEAAAEADATPKQDDGDVAAALTAIRRTLGDKVDDVRVSHRLTDAACCLVAKQGDPGANLERLIKLMDDRAVTNKRVLEVNPKHALVRNIGRLAAADPASPRAALYARVLYDQALLGEGVVEEPAELVKRIEELLVEASSRRGEEQGS